MASFCSSTEIRNFQCVTVASVDLIKLPLRDILASHIKPVDLYHKIRSCSTLKLRPDQQKICLIPPPGVPDYNTFDVTLLYTLIRNLCSLPCPAQGWGNEPKTTDTQISDDIERLRLFRNNYYAHAESAVISNAKFEDVWKNLKLIFKRIQPKTACSIDYEEQLIHIERTKFTDDYLTTFRVLLEALVTLEKHTDNRDEPTVSIRGENEIMGGDTAYFEADVKKADSSCWSITWHRRRGDDIKYIDTTVEKYSGSTKRKLVINDVCKEDEGEYQALLSFESKGPDHKSRNTIRLHVIGDVPRVRIFVDSPVCFGSETIIKSVVSSTPTPEKTEWQKSKDETDFHLIGKPDIYLGSNENFKNPFLVIPKTTFADKLFYRLWVWNRVGKSASNTFYLNVTGSPPNITTSFVTNIKNRSVKLMGEVYFLENSPGILKTLWTKNGEKINIKESGGKLSELITDNPSLTITDVGPDDAGEYKVTAVNAVGSTTSEVIVLGIPSVFSERVEDEINGGRRITVTITSFPAPCQIRWNAKSKDDDTFTPIDINAEEYDMTTVTFPHPMLVVRHRDQLENNCYQIEVTNFIGKIVQTISGNNKPTVRKKDIVQNTFYKDRGARVRFTKLSNILAKEFPPQKLEILKFTLTNSNIVQNQTSVMEATSALQCIRILQDEELFTQTDVIVMQFLCTQTECLDLHAKCVEYAEQQKAMCYFEKPPVNGYKNAQFHVKGELSSYTKDYIQDVIETVAAILDCKVEDILLNGVQHSKSFLLFLSVKEVYIQKLLAMNEQDRLRLIRLNIDYLIIDKETIHLERPKDNGMNGDNLPPVDTGQTELAEERKVIQQVLSGTPDPVVSEIEARRALILLAFPEWDPNEFDIDPADFRFTLLLSDKGKEGKYKLVYSGDATEITFIDLKPAIDYHIRVYTSLEDIKGNTTEPVKFTTSACEPDPPSPPKLANKNKTLITLEWNSTCENGAKISTYTLEIDKGNGEYVEVYNGLQRQTRINKLQVSTKYTFRLAAINSIGKSKYSEPASFYTSGSVPSPPDFLNILSEPFSTSLGCIPWIKHPNEDSFKLQMDDKTTLAALNDEGQSKWSEVVDNRTKPDRPAPPPKPQIKGKIHAYHFIVVWEPPKDNGGAEITKYIVETDDGRGYKTLYEQSEREHVCHCPTPGQMYMVRVACCNVVGRSEFSEPCVAITQAVVPGQCQVPKLQGNQKATSLHLEWANPEYDGGATVSEFAVQKVTPDNACRKMYKGRDLDCIVAGLSPDRPYLFQVRAFNRVGGRGWPDPFDVVSGAGVPDPPKAPHVAFKSAYLALVSWEPPVNNGATIIDYRLEWQQKTEVTDFAMLYTGPNQSYEIKGLTPATLYLFRVQAINSAGQGPYSPVASCVTPPSSPSSVTIHRHTATATSITLFWKEPNSNGNDITAYNLEVGDKQFTIGAVTEYTIETLQPETSHKIRIQAVNSSCVGPFSAPVRVTTRPLPPNPPKLECIALAPNSLKLKWGHQLGLDTNHYTLEMEKEDGSFQAIYKGFSHFFKVNKLQETTNYNFRVYASNDVGSGPYSGIYSFSTTKAPPPTVRAPWVSNLSQQTCSIEWQPCKAIQGSSLEYILQLQGEQEYQKIYRGEDTCFQVENLSPKSDYYLRVCAIRICEDGSEVVGAFSPVVSFTTQGHEPVSPQEVDVKQESKLVESKPLTDQQWAMIILMGFVVFAVLVAIIAQQIIKYRSSSIPR